jgi:NAD+ kinase
MKRIGIICKWGRTEPTEIMGEFTPWLQKRGVEVYTDNVDVEGAHVCEFGEMPERVDMVIVLGGDGTMLGAARLCAQHEVPVLGVNLGGLGFITEVATTQLYAVMEDVLAGRYELERRIMLSAKLQRDGRTVTECTALNDVAVTKGTLARIIDLETWVNGKYVNLFKGDGLIVGTPTGSTAYNMSAGGPILFPTLNCLVMTPVCPHTLSNRPIVLPDDVHVEVVLKSHGEDVMVTYDGVVAENVKQGDRVTVERAPYVTTMIMPRGRSHFEILRSKLRWGER